LASRIGEVREMQHGCLRIDGFAEFVGGFDDDELDAGGAELVIERVAMGFLDDDFGFHSGEIGKLLDEFGIVPGENTREAGLHSRRRARGD
jgi:hypothetical protein